MDERIVAVDISAVIYLETNCCCC